MGAKPSLLLLSPPNVDAPISCARLVQYVSHFGINDFQLIDLDGQLGDAAVNN